VRCDGTDDRATKTRLEHTSSGREEKHKIGCKEELNLDVRVPKARFQHREVLSEPTIRVEAFRGDKPAVNAVTEGRDGYTMRVRA